jgi:hypothetical protein
MQTAVEPQDAEARTVVQATPLVSVTLVLKVIAPLTSLGDRGSIGLSVAPTVPVSGSRRAS